MEEDIKNWHALLVKSEGKQERRSEDFRVELRVTAYKREGHGILSTSGRQSAVDRLVDSQRREASYHSESKRFNKGICCAHLPNSWSKSIVSHTFHRIRQLNIDYSKSSNQICQTLLANPFNQLIDKSEQVPRNLERHWTHITIQASPTTFRGMACAPILDPTTVEPATPNGLDA